MQILLTVAYDGTAYAGWQRQTNGLAVQQKLEEGLSALLKQPVVVRGASRTDAGVHALGQRASFFTEALRIPLDKFPYVLNGKLPSDMSVTAAEMVPDNFNPRFRARQKTYCYQYYNADCPNPLLCRYSGFVPQKLEVAAMVEGASFFVGRHDFKAFCAVGGNGTERVVTAAAGKTMPLGDADNTEKKMKSTVREIYRCAVEAQGSLITLTVTGNGFLYNMVRIIAGTVLYAGMKKITPEDIPGIIASKDRTRAGKTMPPEGLTLVKVDYD